MSITASMFFLVGFCVFTGCTDVGTENICFSSSKQSIRILSPDYVFILGNTAFIFALRLVQNISKLMGCVHMQRVTGITVNR